MSELNITITERPRDTRAALALVETYLGYAEAIFQAGATATHLGAVKATAYTDPAGREAVRLEFGAPERAAVAVEGMAAVVSREREKDPASGDRGAGVRLKARATSKKALVAGWRR